MAPEFPQSTGGSSGRIRATAMPKAQHGCVHLRKGWDSRAVIRLKLAVSPYFSENVSARAKKFKNLSLNCYPLSGIIYHRKNFDSRKGDSIHDTE